MTGVVPREGTVSMIGRFDSTEDRWRAHRDGVARATALLAIAVLIAVGGWATAAPAQVPKARVNGVVVPTPAKTPATGDKPELLPDLGQVPTGRPVADEPPPGSMAPPPGAMAVPPDEGARPKRDDRVIPAEAEENPLPAAKEPPGGPVANPVGAGAGPDPFVLPADRLSLGKQRVQLSVEVQANPVINLGKESTVRLVVNNESNIDASGVSVVYQLPDGLQFKSSTPEATPDSVNKSLYYWKNPMLAANGQWVIVLKVVATAAKACEHAATVTAKTGSRASTTVQEPKLKVEATSSPGRVLKGNQVTFQIAVYNPGTGPARNVIVQAKLSTGLRLGNDDIVEQTIGEIGPGQRVELEPLIVDTVAGGQQNCVVDVRSPDVNPVVEDQRVTRTVDVTRPELAVKLEGQASRYTGQTNDYKLTVTNPGTAPAKQVKVVASLPSAGGKLKALPAGAKFDKATRKLFWSIGQLEPGQTVDLAFLYDTSTPGLYRANAEATSGELRASDTMTTDVSGLAVLDIKVDQDARVLDVGKINYYDIIIKNSGTKEATRLQLSGKLTPNLKVLRHFGVDQGKFMFKEEGEDKGRFIFPEIDRLAVGQSIKLSLEVQATESGPAGCHVFLAHAEMATPDEKVEDVISTTVTGNGRPRTASTKQP